ncbi:FAD-dependent oxidoreductase [Legionella drancourtii]|uniref:FAD dependent oxidoreductase domain-containing protein n=1 Tax=Legionella drancourtii LLAP12 TaxID=658187 RepID=G9EN84_9GAMM|nr:FAD-dependent oxidoreductase [Legionella drancourtii]EHL31245.1 hypothetical protein LDG_6706 [Legionella drancourtii LLAP12]
MIRKQYDLAIIGGGIIGLMTALVSKITCPHLHIAIIEQSSLATGASLYSAGLSAPISKGIFTAELIKRSKNVISDLSKHLNLGLTFTPCLHLINEENVLNFKENYLGNTLEEISPSKIKNLSLDKLTIPRDKQCFMSNNDVHYASITQLIARISYFLKDQQVSIYEASLVEEIEAQDGFCHIKCTHGLLIKATQLVIATGPWLTYKIKTNFSEEMKAAPSFVKKIIAFHLNQKPTEHNSVIMMHDDDSFLLPLPYSYQWLFSLNSQEMVDNPQQSHTISKDELSLGTHILEQYGLDFTALFSGGRVFCDSYSKNREVNIQKIAPNIVNISGASGSGYRLSYGIAQKAMELIGLGS